MMTAQDDLDEDTTAFASVATDVDVSMVRKTSCFENKYVELVMLLF